MKLTEQLATVSVIGAGSWGTSIAVVIGETHPEISLRLWAYKKSVISSINTMHENQEYLPGVSLPYNIAAFGNLKEAVAEAEVVIIATPSKALPDTVQKLSKYISPNTCICFLTKGFCKIDGRILTVSQTIETFIPQAKGKTVAVSGPSHAEEVSKRFHTCLNIASKDAANRKLISGLLTSTYLQCREQEDIIGVEVGGTLKNPAAIAAGIISVLPDCGDNLAGALISEAMKEMIRLGKYFKAKEETIIDISGLGDLVATALSSHSRNRRFGRDIARQLMEKGNRVPFMDRLLFRVNPKVVIEKMGEKMDYLAEGAYAIEPLIEIAEANNIPLPVYSSLYEVLLNKKDPTLLIETIKNPDRYEEIYGQTKIHISQKKKGLENARGRLFKIAIKNNAMLSLFDERNGAALEPDFFEKLSAYRELIDGKPNKKEKMLVDGALKEFNKKTVEPLVDIYIDSIADNYSRTVFRLFMFLISLGRFFANSPFNRKKLQIEGDMYKLSSLSELGNIIYILGNKGGFDFPLALKSIVKMQMPIPRFMVISEAVSGRIEALFVKLAGGFIINENKYENPIYRKVFFAYLSTLMENGVPLLLYRFYGKTKISEFLLQSLKKTMLEQSMEIMLAPLSVAKTNPDPKTNRRGIFPLRSHLKGGMIYRFSDFIFLSEFTKEESKFDSVSEALEEMFKKSKPWYAHTLMAKVFIENGNVIPKDKAEEYALRFIEAEGIIFQGKTKKMIENGILWLRRKRIIKKQDKVYVVENLEELKRVGELF